MAVNELPPYSTMRRLILSEKGLASKDPRKEWRHGPTGANYEEFRELLRWMKRMKIVDEIGIKPLQDIEEAQTDFNTQLQDSKPKSQEQIDTSSKESLKNQVPEHPVTSSGNGAAHREESSPLPESTPTRNTESPEETTASAGEPSTSECPSALSPHESLGTDQGLVAQSQLPESKNPPQLTQISTESVEQSQDESGLQAAGDLRQEKRANGDVAQPAHNEAKAQAQDETIKDTGASSVQEPTTPQTQTDTTAAKPASSEAPQQNGVAVTSAAAPEPPPEKPEEEEPPLPKGFTSTVKSIKPAQAQRIDRRGLGGGRVKGDGADHQNLVRMVAVFEDCAASVTRVRFSRHRPEIFSYAAKDGTLRICHVGRCKGTPSTVLENASTPTNSPMKRGRATSDPAGGSPAKKAAQTGSPQLKSSSLFGSPLKKPAPAPMKTPSPGAKKGVSPASKGGATTGGVRKSPVQGQGKAGAASGKVSPSPVKGNVAAGSSSTKAGTKKPAEPKANGGGVSGGSASAAPSAGTSETPSAAPSTGTTVEQVPRVMHELTGHTKEVTDFDWSTDDEYMCSSSLDKSLRVWEVGSGKCLRIIYTELHQLCVRFHPKNSNFLVAANAKPELTVVNFSTGRVVSRYSLSHRVSALEAAKPDIFFAGDSEGSIHSFVVDPMSGSLTLHHSNRTGLNRPAPTMSLHFRPTSALANTPVLLACCQDGSVRFFSVAVEIEGYLFLKCSLQLSQKAPNLTANFAPCLASPAAIEAGTGEFIVTGNTDSQLCFFDFFQPRRLFVGKALGHKGLVMDVSFNLTGEWLASGDATGVIILWTPAPP